MSDQTEIIWNDLLSGVRLRNKEIRDRVSNNEYDLRNDFDDDYSRLIFSSAVRRLQDKAQVFPLDNGDFVRTRLTHSLEVSSIGRSIGVSVEERLIESNELDLSCKGKISSLLSVVGLVHDLGNPPYGHFGEAAIQRFFKEWFKNKQKEKFEEVMKLTDEEKADFTNFEGNVQTFRLLTKLNNLKDQYGFNLSVGTLASILKYPRSSLEGNKSGDERKEHNLGVSYKKFGYFQSELERFETVKEKTGISNHRHPVAFLLEAADDIAYSAADIEDGCKKKVLDYHTIKEILEKNLYDGNEFDKGLLNSFINNYKENKERSDRLDNTVQKFRIEAQGYMIKSVVKEFLTRHEEILSGKYDKEIIKTSEASNVRKAFQDLANIIFNNKEILAREYAGGVVIRGLLKMFVKAVTSDDWENPRTSEGKLYLLISDNYRDIMKKYPYRKNNCNKPSLYDRLHLVTDFVCGMTDSYALNLYKKLSGINL